MNRKNILLCVIFAFLIIGCAICARKLSPERIAKICSQHCQDQPPAAYVLMDTKWQTDLNGTSGFGQSPGSIWVQGADGMYEHPHKGAKLNPDCFSKDPLEVRDSNGVPKLDKVDLTKENTTIILINFTEDGGVESHQLSDLTGSQAKGVKDTIHNVLTIPFFNGQVEYIQIRDALTSLNGASLTGRPTEDQILANGFEHIDINPVDDKKTPFYKRVGKKGGEGTYEHVFFYVLLDEKLKFNRSSPAIIPYGPAAENSVDQLYTPYIQYDIAPTDLNDAHPSYPLYPTDNSQVEVLPVHFLRENMAEDIPREGDTTKCSYPYDLGVIAEGQLGVGQPDTPLLIDPETETDGPPIKTVN